MDLKLTNCRSLPPRVEGKIHGYLKLTIDELLWLRKCPDDVSVLASWWGETDSVQLRIPKAHDNESVDQFYAIRTNINLFKDYICNCESLEFIFMSHKTHQVIGTAHATCLPDIFDDKFYSKYISIFNSNQVKIGELHLVIYVFQTTNVSSSKKKSRSHKNSQDSSPNKQIINQYKSRKQAEHDKLLKTFNNTVTDKYVAHIVARAQRLRGAMLKESQDESFNLNHLSDDLMLENNNTEDVIKAYDYLLGKNIDSEERSNVHSNSSSFIESTNEEYQPTYNDKIQLNHKLEKILLEPNEISENAVERIDHCCSKQKEISLLDYVDSLLVHIPSLTLTQAGYRRVRSSCISPSEGVYLSVTYFVQYNPYFANKKIENTKNCLADKRPIKVSSRRQCDEVIYFDHQSVFKISKSWTEIDLPLTFKVFHRHLNQQTPTELGIGSIDIKDIVKSEDLSIASKVAIVNKGIKIGELSVIVELGCDEVHFGKDFVEALTSGKENIPVYDRLNRPKEVVTSLRKHAASGNDNESRESDSDVFPSTKSTNTNIVNNIKQNENVIREDNFSDNRKTKVESPRGNIKNKVLLHGLIYVAQGRYLPTLSSFIVCRAFWREDTATSQTCLNVENPVYNFHQLVPLIYGQELLDRVKDSFIIIEIYCKYPNETEKLIGLARLPVHQFYIAYRDPKVLPHLLESKYPVISVDGWVSITDPVTSNSYGQIHALVALGTAEQIACLEMTRGLRNNVTSLNPNGLENRYCPKSSISESTTSIPESKSQECQTDLTILRDPQYNEIYEHEKSTYSNSAESDNAHANFASTSEKSRSSESVGLNKVESSVQTEFIGYKKPYGNQQLGSFSSMNNFSDNSSNNSNTGDHFHLPEMYRSVGVGAEFDEPTDKTVDINEVTNLNNSVHSFQSSVNPHQNDSNYVSNKVTFKASIDIECAYHLPRIQKANAVIEPSTYVTFQPMPNDVEDHYNAYIVTNICMFNCNPRWEWKCNVNLPTDFLTNDKKRLILKIWRLHDANISDKFDFEKDSVIGFAAIDLSVLAAGFPLVSGWFHIMDFTGKCHGQIKVNIKPLENISLFLKGNEINKIGVGSSNSSLAPSNSQTSWSKPQNQCEPATSAENQENMIDFGINFVDSSMSFLSRSLQQKLTELNEITDRLKTRLDCVTSTDFDEDFDFDINNQPHENESPPNEKLTNGTSALNFNTTRANGQRNNERAPVSTNQPQLPIHKKYTCNNKETATNHTNVNVPNFQSTNITNQNGHQHPRNETYENNSNGDVLKGTKMHINHLLDQLSAQLSVPPKMGNVPMQPNVMDLLNSLRHHNNNNNNLPNDQKCGRAANTSFVSIGNEAIHPNNKSFNYNSFTYSEPTQDNNKAVNDTGSAQNEAPAMNRISSVIREELATEENGDSELDNLTSFLITSNIRHINTDDALSPFLYQNIIPDMNLTNPVSLTSLEGQDSQNSQCNTERREIAELDSRYSENFKKTLNNGLQKLQDHEKNGISSSNGDNNSQISWTSSLSDSQTRMMQRETLSVTTDSTLIPARMTSSGTLDYFGNTLDVTTVPNSSNDMMDCGTSVLTLPLCQSEQSFSKCNETEMSLINLAPSESSVSSVSRQAPDGGNPTEEPIKSAIAIPPQQPDNLASWSNDD